jgi:hypothetical protein
MGMLAREVTYDVLLTALRRSFGPKIAEDALRRIAEYVLTIFGYAAYYPDYRLNQEERNLFYLLEDHGILMTNEEKFNFPRGGTIRIGFWVLKKKRIFELACPYVPEVCEEEQINVYDTIDQDIWHQHGQVADESQSC